MVPTGTWKARFSGNRMLKPLLANVMLAFLLTMPGCGKNDLPPDGQTGASSFGTVKVGSPAPDIPGFDLDGKPIKLSDFRGKVVDLSFWAGWCGPCRGLFPHEKSLVEKYRDRPFVLVGVNGDASPEAGAEVSRQFKLPWRSFWDDPKLKPMPITSAYRLEYWPTSFIIDPNGILQARVGNDPYALDAAIERAVVEAESSSKR
jgi:thiol-disulfide isomerase/thioredoxin